MFGNYGSGEALGGAASGAGTGMVIGGPWGAAIGAGAGLFMGASQAKARKQKQKSQAELSATASELSPWLTPQAQMTSQVPMQNLQEQADSASSPWGGVSALAKSYSEIKNMENKQAMLEAMGGWGGQPQTNEQLLNELSAWQTPGIN